MNRPSLVEDHLVMFHAAIEVDEHPCGAVVHDRVFDRLPGKRANRLERLPPGDDRYVHRAIPIPLKQRRALIAANAGELGGDGGLPVPRVFLHALRSSPGFPNPRDHGAPSPTTTFHGRTRHSVTRPCITYGSARAKRSAMSGLSARNTSSAPSGGSPSAPASTSSPRAWAARTRPRCASRCGSRLSTNRSKTSYISAKFFIRNCKGSPPIQLALTWPALLARGRARP